MSEIHSENSEFCSAREDLRVTPEMIADEMRTKTRRLCLAADPSLKEAMNQVARKLGMTTSRLKQFLYREARRIEAHEADRVRALDQKMAAVFERQKIIRKEMKQMLSEEGRL